MKQQYQFLSIEQFNELLQNWNNDKVKISKLEIDDLDEIIMQLEEVSYKNEVPTIDGYEPVHSLQLNGQGMIETENDGSQPLPSSLYEIPLENDTLYEFDGTTFLISTDRGVYKIERLHQS